jgi:hypothetical protein
MAQGIRDFLPLWPNAAECLAELCTGDGCPLPPCLVAGIRRELRRLKLVEEMIGKSRLSATPSRWVNRRPAHQPRLFSSGFGRPAQAGAQGSGSSALNIKISDNNNKEL